jgi:hypothetical protein
LFDPGGLILPEKKERLAVRLFSLVEGEAEGRWAIAALFSIVVVALVVWRFT